MRSVKINLVAQQFLFDKKRIPCQVYIRCKFDPEELDLFPNIVFEKYLIFDISYPLKIMDGKYRSFYKKIQREVLHTFDHAL